MLEHPPPTVIDVVRPVIGCLANLADTARDLPGETLLPAHDSIAMRELADEPQFTSQHWPDPVHAAHSVAAMLRFAAADHLKSYARLFESEPIPVYSHLVLARACIDACGQGYWAGEPRIGTARRIQRYEAQRLHNAEQLRRSPVPDSKESRKRTIENVRAGSKQFGWLVSASSERCGQETYPKPRQYIEAVVNLHAPRAHPLGLGYLLWWYQSGAAHGGTYALMQSIEVVDDVPGLSGIQRGAIYTSARSVLIQSIPLGQTFVNMIGAHIELFGWNDDQWIKARDAFLDQARKYMDIMDSEDSQIEQSQR